MENLFNEKDMTTGKENTEPLAKLPQYTSEKFLDDILYFFYAEGLNFGAFKEILERSMQKDSDVKFIKEIEKHNFNILETFIILYIATLKIKKRYETKSELIETLIKQKIAKPSTILNLLSDDSKLFKSKCIKYNFSFEDSTVSVDKSLFNSLLNINKADKKDISDKKDTESDISIMPNEIYEKLNKYIVGQDSATKNISAAVYEHIIKCKINKDEHKKDKLDKTNTLIIGPTGTGKTFICNTLSKILNIPLYIADASQITESGYVGLNPDSIFVGLKQKCKHIMKGNKFPMSIIYIDEIDKIAIGNNNLRDSIGNKGVQEEFLKMLESDKYVCDGGRFSSNGEYDISNIMFILGGAFSGLEKIIEARLNINKEKSIGFFKGDFTLQDNSNILQQVTTEDIIKYGFIPEFIGRLPNKVILNALTKQDLIKILTESQNNVISQYKQVFTEAGIKLNILDETIEYVAEQAIKNNTGARGLKGILSSILNKILFETSSKGQKDFTLSPKEFSLFSNTI